MTTEVIILAQGTQQRLGMEHGYKQLLPLPACDDVPIIGRTLRQVAVICPGSAITLVAWHGFYSANFRYRKHDNRPYHYISPRATRRVRYVTLGDPGNSSLKGIARYLESGMRIGRITQDTLVRTVVLFGDVVYSWTCLEALFRLADTGGFVGTSDLSNHGGELWGVAWADNSEDAMITKLRTALSRHPQFDEYQPGQMRRWVSAGFAGAEGNDIRKAVIRCRDAGSYIAIDDYTRDIDLPEHLKLLPALSDAARADDSNFGVTW